MPEPTPPTTPSASGTVPSEPDVPPSRLDVHARAAKRAKLNLALVLIGFMLLFIACGRLLTQHALGLAQIHGFDIAVIDIRLFAASFGLDFLVLVSFPLMLIVGYRGLEDAVRARRLSEVLSLCGLDDNAQQIRLREHSDRTGLSAFLLPMLVNLALLALLWSITLLPHGLSGMYDFLQPNAGNKLGIADLFPHVAANASPLTWTLLGVYFYSITLLFRRWMAADLTAPVLWWVNVRLIVGIIIGMLLTTLTTGADSPLSSLGSWVGAMAFFIGIVPDMLLRWLGRGLSRLYHFDGVDALALFGATELQRCIPGMSFWQADRLAEEGIDSVTDLAMQDLPSLLIRTRFPTPLVLYWVDRALLCDVAGNAMALLDRVHINRATQLVSLVRVLGPTALSSMVQDADCVAASGEPTPAGPAPAPTLVALDAAKLQHMTTALTAGPNLHELLSYAENSTNPAAHQATISTLRPVPSQHPRSSARTDHSNHWNFALAMLLLAILAGMATAAHMMADQILTVAAGWNLGSAAVDLYGFAFVYTLLLFLLISLPLLLVLGYRGIKADVLENDVQRALGLCGIESGSLYMRMQEFREQQGLWSYLFPVLVSIALSFMVWSMVLLPHGAGGLFPLAAKGADTVRIGLAMALAQTADQSTPLMWVMLGGYCYGITMLLQRAIRSQLNNECVWHFNVRLVICFVVGLLIMALFDFAGRNPDDGVALVSGLAFAAGMVPDSALRWIARQLQQKGITDAEANAVFAPSDLRQQFPGMSFWQRDAFAEHGIDSVQDLAMRDIPDMLMRAPLLAQLLMSLVDRALLCHRAGDDTPVFHRGNVNSATTLTALCGPIDDASNHSVQLLRSLNQGTSTRSQASDSSIPRVAGAAAGPSPPPKRMSAGALYCIRAGLAGDPNLHVLSVFWSNLRKTDYSSGNASTRSHSARNPMNVYRVIASALELRSGPGTQYETLEQLPNGTELEQIPPSPHWTQVKRVSDGRIGWVYNAYIRPTQPAPTEPPVVTPSPPPGQPTAADPAAVPRPNDGAGTDLVFDVSHFQPNIDFHAARGAGLRAVFHKASEGLQYVDPRYANAREQALAAGLLWGAYHFGTGDDALAQAEHFLSVAKPDGRTLLVLDLERNPQGASMSIEQARTFVTRVQQATGKWPGLYSGSYIRDNLGSIPDPVLGNCWFWLAEYGSVPKVPPTWKQWSLWQHTDGHVGPGPHAVAGVGACDRDRFAGDEQALIAFWSANAGKVAT